MISLPVQEQFRRFITPHVNQLFRELGCKIQFDPTRVQVWADSDKYNFKEDAFVWGQKRDKIPVQYSVYFDGIHVCIIEPNTSRDQTLKMFWQGFLKAYSLKDNDPGKIWLDTSMYEDIAKQKKEQKKKQQDEIIKAIEDKPVTTEVQSKAKEIALDVAKKPPSTP